MRPMLKEFYLNHEGTGQPVMVGYKVKSIAALEKMNYRIGRMYEDDFIEARKRGTVYAQREGFDRREDLVYLFDRKGMWIGEAYKIGQ
ncbi:hypothetical protein [Trichococcus sp.]|uniref:hypothetical protein n=1 Tax=Trichococcus sp. TaxID=1985464 RepID=UPI003C7E22BE